MEKSKYVLFLKNRLSKVNYVDYRKKKIAVNKKLLDSTIKLIEDCEKHNILTFEDVNIMQVLKNNYTLCKQKLDFFNR
jgi:hypothetical protein